MHGLVGLRLYCSGTGAHGSARNGGWRVRSAAQWANPLHSTRHTNHPRQSTPTAYSAPSPVHTRALPTSHIPSQTHQHHQHQQTSPARRHYQHHQHTPHWFTNTIWQRIDITSTTSCAPSPLPHQGPVASTAWGFLRSSVKLLAGCEVFASQAKPISLPGRHRPTNLHAGKHFPCLPSRRQQ